MSEPSDLWAVHSVTGAASIVIAQPVYGPEG